MKFENLPKQERTKVQRQYNALKLHIEVLLEDSIKYKAMAANLEYELSRERVKLERLCKEYEM